MSHHKAKTGYLYVVATQSGTVKFGISKNPKERIKSHHYSMGRVSPIIYEWISKECGGYFEIESRLVEIYGGEYVSGVSHQEIQELIESMIEEWDSSHQGYYEPVISISKPENSGRSTEIAEALNRANFVIQNDDESLRAYFLVPVLCVRMGMPYQGMPNEVRDYLANAISDYSEEDLCTFLHNFFAGGELMASALERAGISKKDFEFEVAA